MIERIGALVCCIILAAMFVLIATSHKKNGIPMNFFIGDEVTAEMLKDVNAYNKEMSSLYMLCALVAVLAGVLFYVNPAVGKMALPVIAIGGFVLAYKRYRAIAKKHMA